MKKLLWALAFILPNVLYGQRQEMPLLQQIDSIRAMQVADTMFLSNSDFKRSRNKHISDTLRVHHNKSGNWQSGIITHLTNKGIMVEFKALKNGCRLYLTDTDRGLTGYVLSANGKQYRYTGYDALHKRYVFVFDGITQVKID